MKTLVIVSHPYPENSRVIKYLAESITDLNDVTVRNLEALYGNDITAIDVAAEQAACAGMERIVFMYPIHWFNLTPMLKAYLNEVWTYGWAFGPEGNALQGKEMLVVVAAGAGADMYSLDGLINSTMEQVLTPMKACALYVGMRYPEPITLLGSLAATDEQLVAVQKQLVDRLQTES